MTLHDLEAAAAELDTQPMELEAQSREEIADSYLRLESLRDLIGIWQAELARELNDRGEGDERYETPSGVLERKWVSKRWVKWRNEELGLAATNAVLARVAVTADGETVGDLDTAVKTMGLLGSVFRLGGSSVRPKQLREELGLEADEFAESVAGGYQVRVVR